MLEMILFLSIPVLYPVVALVVSWFIARRPKRISRRIAAGLLSLSVFVLIPTWDEILGRLALTYLCETEAGIKVFKQVDLEAAYWHPQGAPDIRLEKIAPGKYLEMVGDEYYLESVYQRITPFLRLGKRVTRIINVNTKDIISERIYFGFSRGWVLNSIGIMVPEGLRCEGDRSFRPILLQSFRRID